MVTFYRIIDNRAEIGSGKLVLEGYKKYIIGQEPQELIDGLAFKTQDETIAHFKSIYLGIINNKLKELDYDSLATVKLWEGDATFGAEATRILNWYKAIIAKNHELLNAGNPLTDEEYLAHINGIVF